MCDLQTLCSILFAEEDFSANGDVSAVLINSVLLKNVQISCICKEMSVIASTLKRRQKLVQLFHRSLHNVASDTILHNLQKCRPTYHALSTLSIPPCMNHRRPMMNDHDKNDILYFRDLICLPNIYCTI